MILPNKHIDIKRSLLGLGARIIERLQRPRTVTSLWEEVRELPGIGTFENFSLALDFLFIVGAVELREGLLQRQRQ